MKPIKLCIFGFVGCLWACVFSACAFKDRSKNTADEILPTDPSPANYASWSHAWDGERWIIALKEREPSLDQLRLSFANSFSLELKTLQKSVALGVGESPQRFFNTFAQFPSLQLEAVAGRKDCTAKLCPSFVFATLSPGKVPWQKLFRFAALEELELLQFKSPSMFSLFWKTFAQMNEIKFAEPDLVAPPVNFFAGKVSTVDENPLSRGDAKDNANTLAEKGSTSKLADEEAESGDEKKSLENRSYVPHIKDIRIVDAEKEEKARKFALREVVVAVLDTGVDSANPYLKDRMFKMPGRENVTAPGLFEYAGKTYLGDAHGIDSSWEQSLPQESIALSPGSADIGGPGADCPYVEGVTQPSSVNEILESPAGTKCSHGTHVGGLIAAQDFVADQTGEGSNAAVYARGVCRNCKLLPIRVARSVAGPPLNNGVILDSSQIRALQFVLGFQSSTGRLYVNVVNMSIGQLTSTRGMRTVIDAVFGTGIIVVAAAANYNTDKPYFPAAYDNVLSVCATSTEEGRGVYAKANFSNFGEWVDICAPGEDIWSTVPGKLAKLRQSGTSMASPIVAGAAGYLMGLADALGVKVEGRSYRIINTILERSNWEGLYLQADKDGQQNNAAYQFELPDKTGVEFLGRGFLDVHNALTGAKASNRISPPVPQVEGGCVVSSVARKRSLGSVGHSSNFWEVLAKIFGSLPMLLWVMRLALKRG